MINLITIPTAIIANIMAIVIAITTHTKTEEFE